MERITVWTKQHRAVLEQLEQVGRYTAKREYVLKENEDCSRFVLEAYNWLVKHSPLAAQKPADADYPVWLSFSREAQHRYVGAAGGPQAGGAGAGGKVGDDSQLLLHPEG